MELDPLRSHNANLTSIELQRRMGMSQEEMVNAQIPPWLIFFSCIRPDIPLDLITPQRLNGVMRQGGTDHPDPTLRTIG